jgi:hypothetical protein
VKLSDAIRLGAMIRPQAHGRFFRDGNSCALGAALEASGLAVYDEEYSMDEQAPLSDRLIVDHAALIHECPAGCSEFSHLPHRIDAVIVHLNDRHEWTREQIADWVETYEPRAESAAVDASDPHACGLTTRG